MGHWSINPAPRRTVLHGPYVHLSKTCFHGQQKMQCRAGRHPHRAHEMSGRRVLPRRGHRPIHEYRASRATEIFSVPSANRVGYRSHAIVIGSRILGAVGNPSLRSPRLSTKAAVYNRIIWESVLVVSHPSWRRVRKIYIGRQCL